MFLKEKRTQKKIQCSRFLKPCKKDAKKDEKEDDFKKDL